MNPFGVKLRFMLENHGTRLAPANDKAQECLTFLSGKQAHVAVTLHPDRSADAHNLFFHCVAKMWENFEDRVKALDDSVTTKVKFRDWSTCKAGFRESFICESAKSFEETCKAIEAVFKSSGSRAPTVFKREYNNKWHGVYPTSYRWDSMEGDEFHDTTKAVYEFWEKEFGVAPSDLKTATVKDTQ